MANDNAGGAAQHTDAELESDLELSTVEDTASLTPEQVTQLKKERDTLAAQKNHWRGKAIDPESKKPWRDLAAEAKTRVEQPKPIPQQPADGQLEKRLSNVELVNEKRDFGYRHDLSPEAVDNVFSYAQGRNVKPEEALKDPFVKSGISALKAQERLATNVPGPSRRTTVVEGKTFNEMKPEDRRKNWGHVTGAQR